LVFQLLDLRFQLLDFLLELGFPFLAALKLGLPIADLLPHLQQLDQRLRSVLLQFFRRGFPDRYKGSAC